MWQFFVGLAVGLLFAVIARPKPQSQPPAGLDDIKAPTAEEGREIPVLFGCRRITGPNVVWYGDLRTVAIKSSGGKK